MKKFIVIIVAVFALVLMLNSCALRSELSSDDTLPEVTTGAPDTTVEDDPAEGVDDEEETTADVDTTEGETTDGETTDEETTDEETTEEETTEAETTDEETTEGEEIKVESIELDKYTVNIKIGEDDMPMVTMLPEDAENKGEIWESSDTKVATVNRYGKIVGVGEGECTVTVTSEDNPDVKAEVKVTVKGGVSELKYVNGILIANKTYALPSTYNPGIDADAGNALNEMIAAAANEGISLRMISGFRSYETQKVLYNNYVARDGVAEADRYSARPGHSEHQTGLSFDLNSLEQSFGETREGKWLADNCWKYGFIIRYPHDKEAVTGYMYEPWHVRYLGKDTAKAVYESGMCLEEYLGITSVYAD